MMPPPPAAPGRPGRELSSAKMKTELGHVLLGAAGLCHEHGWSAEELLRAETRRMEQSWRKLEEKNPFTTAIIGAIVNGNDN